MLCYYTLVYACFIFLFTYLFRFIALGQQLLLLTTMATFTFFLWRASHAITIRLYKYVKKKRRGKTPAKKVRKTPAKPRTVAHSILLQYK